MAFSADKPIDGANILLKVGGKPLGFQTDGSISIERATKEVIYKKADRTTSKYTEYSTGKITWSVDHSAYFVVGNTSDVSSTYFKDMYEKMVADTDNEVEVVIEYVEGANTFTLTGNALVTSLSPTLSGSGEDITFSCNLTGTGELALVSTEVE